MSSRATLPLHGVPGASARRSRSSWPPRRRRCRARPHRHATTVRRVPGRPVDGARRCRREAGGQAVYVGDIRVPGMLHGKVLRSAPPRAHRGDRRRPRTRCQAWWRSSRAPTSWTSTPTSVMRSRTGRSSRSTASAPSASRSRRSPRSTRPPRRGPSRRSADYEGSGRRDGRRCARARRAARPRAADPPGTLPRPHARRRARGQRVRRYALDDGDVADGIRHGADRRRGGATRSRASTSTRWRRTRWSPRRTAGHHALGDLPAPVPRARGDRRPLRPAALAGARHRAVPRRRLRCPTRRWSRSRSLRARAGRPVRIVNRVDESMATRRRHGAVISMRTAADADGRLLAREASSTSTPARTPTTGRGSSRPAGTPRRGRIAGRDRVAACVHTNTAPSGSIARSVPRTSSGSASSRSTRSPDARASTRSRCARNLLRRGEVVRGGGKALDADLVGDVEKAAAALGRDEPRAEGHGRGLSVGLLAAGAHPVSSAVVRLESDGEAVVPRRLDRARPGPAHGVRAGRGRDARAACRAVRCLGTDTQFTPYDRSTGASRSTRSLASRSIGPPWRCERTSSRRRVRFGPDAP